MARNQIVQTDLCASVLAKQKHRQHKSGMRGVTTHEYPRRWCARLLKDKPRHGAQVEMHSCEQVHAHTQAWPAHVHLVAGGRGVWPCRYKGCASQTDLCRSTGQRWSVPFTLRSLNWKLHKHTWRVQTNTCSGQTAVWAEVRMGSSPPVLEREHVQMMIYFPTAPFNIYRHKIISV